MKSKIFNFIYFYAAWTACVLGAAKEMPWLGPVVVALWMVGHLVALKDRVAEVRLLVGAAAVGFVLDSALVLLGMMSFPDRAALGWPTTIWMVALWVGLAATLGGSLSFLRGRWMMGAVLGGVSGPLSYLAGARLGALALAPGAGTVAVAIEWSLALPALLWLREKSGGSG